MLKIINNLIMLFEGDSLDDFCDAIRDKTSHLHDSTFDLHIENMWFNSTSKYTCLNFVPFTLTNLL